MKAKYGNLIDAVMGQIYEGKSYKRNDDSDAKAKKEKDQERKDARKKKEQVTEGIKEQSTENLVKRAASITKQMDDLHNAQDATLHRMGRQMALNDPDFEHREGLLSRYRGILAVVQSEISARKRAGVAEGKSYKRNKDEDVDAKKKEDKQKRDAKKPVEEALGDGMSVESKRKTLRRLIKKVKDLAIEHSDNPSKEASYLKLVAKYEQELADLKTKKVAEDFASATVTGESLKPGMLFRVITGPMARRDWYCAKVKESTEQKRVYLIDESGEQGWYDATAVKPSSISMRMADRSRAEHFKSAINHQITTESESPSYAEQDLINDLRTALSQLWKYTVEKRIIPAAVQEEVKRVLVTSHATRPTLAHALRDLWKYNDHDDIPNKIQSQVRVLLSRSGVMEDVEEAVFEDDEDHAGSLDEAYGRGWAILPATVALYGKKVVDITTAASEWATAKSPTTILVCHKSENGRDRMLFLSSSGDCRSQYKVGQSSETYHDQTGASKGIYTILNIVVFQGGEIIYKANEQGMTGKASVAVFK